eukprot:11019922-Karenia_brevis.AAC.1
MQEIIIVPVQVTIPALVHDNRKPLVIPAAFVHLQLRETIETLAAFRPEDTHHSLRLADVQGVPTKRIAHEMYVSNRWELPKIAEEDH